MPRLLVKPRPSRNSAPKADGQSEGRTRIAVNVSHKWRNRMRLLFISTKWSSKRPQINHHSTVYIIVTALAFIRKWLLEQKRVRDVSIPHSFTQSGCCARLLGRFTVQQVRSSCRLLQRSDSPSYS